MRHDDSRCFGLQSLVCGQHEVLGKALQERQLRGLSPVRHDHAWEDGLRALLPYKHKVVGTTLQKRKVQWLPCLYDSNNHQHHPGGHHDRGGPRDHNCDADDYNDHDPGGIHYPCHRNSDDDDYNDHNHNYDYDDYNDHDYNDHDYNDHDY